MVPKLVERCSDSPKGQADQHEKIILYLFVLYEYSNRTRSTKCQLKKKNSHSGLAAEEAVDANYAIQQK